MRTVLAILAAGVASMGAAYVLNANADKLPAAVTGKDLQSALFSAVVISMPALIAYGMVAGLSHNAVGLPK